MNIHMASTCLHYGQEVFEGLKAFRGADGKVRLFRVEENAKRMINSGEYLKMAVPSVELFTKACIEAVKLNADYILAPDGSGAIALPPSDAHRRRSSGRRGNLRPTICSPYS